MKIPRKLLNKSFGKALKKNGCWGREKKVKVNLKPPYFGLASQKDLATNLFRGLYKIWN